MTGEEAKERELASWTRVAPGWGKWDAVLSQSSAGVSSRMLELARVAPGQRVFDIASGTGEPALSAAERVGKDGAVVGTDFVEPMLALAREKARQRKLTNVEFQCVDGEAFSVAAGSQDAVTVRWGLMFMPDPGACLARCLAALKPGGRVAAACWAQPQKNPWAALPAAMGRKLFGLPPPAPGATGIFALSDPDRLRSLLTAAGFVEVEVVEAPVRWGPFESAAQAFAWLVELAGPIATMYSGASPEQRTVFAAEVQAEFAKFQSAGGSIELPGVTWIVAGTRP